VKCLGSTETRIRPASTLRPTSDQECWSTEAGLIYNPSMSQLKQLLLAHTAYSAWATSQLLKACSPLTFDQLDSGLGASHSSILRTFRHIHDSERVWLHRIIEGGSHPLPPGPAPEHSFEFLVQSWPELWQGYRQWLESASGAELTTELSTIVPNGADLRVPRWQIVLHAVNHSTLHRGQIITMLRTLGIQPPNTDLTEYCLTL
jgi:uncharacterized damage-inducible protein DinB